MSTLRHVSLLVVLLSIGTLLIVADYGEARKTPAQAADLGAQTGIERTTDPDQSRMTGPPHIWLSEEARATVPGARDEVQALGQQIADMKAQGLYDAALWDQYYNAMYPSRIPFTRRLDQGGEDCASATVIPSLPFSDSGTTVGYNDDYDYSGSSSCPWPSNSPDVVYEYSPAGDEVIGISLCPSYYDTKVIVFVDYCDPSYHWACDDDGCGYLWGYTSEIHNLHLDGGHTYYIVVDGYGGDAGDYEIAIDYELPRPPNDDCADAIELPCGIMDVFVDQTGATLDCPAINTYPEVWYKFFLDPAVSPFWTVRLSYCDSDPDVWLISGNLQNDCACDDYFGYTSLSAGNCASPPQMPEFINFEGVPAGWWYLPVYSDLGNPLTLDLFCEPAIVDSCPEVYCAGSEEVPNDGGCWEPPFESQPIECGEIICGTLIAEPGYRDTDWFIVEVFEPTVFTWDVAAAYPLDVWISVLNEGCDEIYFQDDSLCGELIVTDCMPPGIYYFYLAHHDVVGVPVPTEYRAKLSCGPCEGWPCPNPEQEPNDVFPPEQEILPGDVFCGAIDSPYDPDMVILNMPSESAIRITVNTDGVLHPCGEILTTAGDPIAFFGDTLNVANEFTTTFKLAEGDYVLNVVGAAQTTGQYELWVDLIELDNKVPPPEPVVTLYSIPTGEVELRWYADFFPGEVLRIERAETPDGPWVELDVVPGDQTSYMDGPPYELAFYQVTSIGEREPDHIAPFVGSIINLAHAEDGELFEYMDFEIKSIGWAVDPDNKIVMSHMLAQSMDGEEWIDSDNRFLYDEGLTPIESFNGHILGVYGREVLIDHIAFAQDEEGRVRILEGRGRDPRTDSLMIFSGMPMHLETNNGMRQVGGYWWGWFSMWSWFCAQHLCCDLRVIALCWGAPWGVAYPCGPPNPACILDRQPGPTGGWITYCKCGWQPSPPPANQILCTFYPFVKCEYYPCPMWFPPCVCNVRQCPPPGSWTLVGWGTVGWWRSQCQEPCKFIGWPWNWRWWYWYWYWYHLEEQEEELAIPVR
jgi:hypothetical protein